MFGHAILRNLQVILHTSGAGSIAGSREQARASQMNVLATRTPGVLLTRGKDDVRFEASKHLFYTIFSRI